MALVDGPVFERSLSLEKLNAADVLNDAVVNDSSFDNSDED